MSTDQLDNQFTNVPSASSNTSNTSVFGPLDQLGRGGVGLLTPRYARLKDPGARLPTGRIITRYAAVLSRGMN